MDITIDIRQGLKASRPALTLPVTLEPCPDFARFMGTLSICGVFHHIEAIEVIPDPEGMHAVSSELESRISNYFKENDAVPQTVKLNDKPYIILIEPFAE